MKRCYSWAYIPGGLLEVVVVIGRRRFRFVRACGTRRAANLSNVRWACKAFEAGDSRPLFDLSDGATIWAGYLGREERRIA